MRSRKRLQLVRHRHRDPVVLVFLRLDHLYPDLQYLELTSELLLWGGVAVTKWCRIVVDVAIDAVDLAISVPYVPA